MDKLKIYCMCLDNDYLKVVKKLDYIPVGLKNKNFSNEWLRDNTLKNISKKNPYYGEYTFYYWYWKNMLKYKKKNEWIGFCSYRELWANKKKIKNNHSTKSLIKKIPPEWEGYNAIIGKPLHLKRPRIWKILKYGKIAAFKNFKEIFNSRYSIKFQFDMYHGIGNLDRAIKLLPEKDRYDFNYYVENNFSFNQGNMFISNSSAVINSYFSDVFEWLKECEKIFRFNLSGHRKIRMYTYLAERYLPYWFKKYTNYQN